MIFDGHLGTYFSWKLNNEPVKSLETYTSFMVFFKVFDFDCFHYQFMGTTFFELIHFEIGSSLETIMIMINLLKSFKHITHMFSL